MLQHDWEFWCRADQKEPEGDWVTWMVKAGRGFGKTRIGAEFILKQARLPKRRLALVGSNPADVRDTMVEGNSGIMTIAYGIDRPRYEPTKRRLTWRNGSIATTFSGETPNALRGPQHHAGWFDELAKFRYPQQAWEQFEFGNRLGDDPRAIITTTPRPIPIIRQIMNDPTTIVTHGSTYSNAANLAPVFLSKILRKYEGTRLGRQELYAELLEDLVGALWTYKLLDRYRVDAPPPLRRIVIAIDPAGSSKEDADETGIVVAGLGDDLEGYVLQDASGHYTPAQWGTKAVELYKEWKADAVIGEKNNGGDMVGFTVQTSAEAMKTSVNFKPVTASKGKYTRAEPISALDEQGRVHHVGSLPELEDQMCLAPWVTVQTDRGPLPIVKINAGDKVVTRNGWKDVLWAGCTGVNNLLLLYMDTSTILAATAGHPIATKTGFVPSGRLQPGDEVLICQCQSCVATRSSRALSIFSKMAISAPAVEGQDEARCCIASSGKTPMGQFHAGEKFITAMKTAPTMPCVTSSASRASGTLGSMRHADGGNGLPRIAVDHARKSGHDGNRVKCAVPSAEVHFRPRANALHSAHVDVSAATIIAVQAFGKWPVFNLTIDDTPEFLADGVITHNCTWLPGMDSPDRMDARVWALTELMLGEQTTGLLDYYAELYKQKQDAKEVKA